MINRSRVGWIDFARGIAILCVIIGHTTYKKSVNKENA